MTLINDNFKKFPGNYVFTEVARRVALFQAENPQVRIIRMSIGDVSRPLPAPVVQAMHEAVDELAEVYTFCGYGPNQGHAFLREAIAKHDYQERGIDITADEIYVSDGAKTDCGAIVDLFSNSVKVAVCDPVYPVYVDSNVMAGRAGDFDPATEQWTNIEYLPMVPENDFEPPLPTTAIDLVYLCSPSNPTGTVLGRASLEKWVQWANEHNAILLYDAAYERFIEGDEAPRSIFEIPAAKTCAIEFRSFSKTAGFTSSRCGFVVIPAQLERDGMKLGSMWLRRQSTKFNGASYVIQRGAEAVYLPESQRQIDANMAYYRENARVVLEVFSQAGLPAYGGVNSPYVWAKVPEGMTSWSFFDALLSVGVVVTPGCGFGSQGEGYIRITSFGSAEDVLEAAQRMKRLLQEMKG